MKKKMLIVDIGTQKGGIEVFIHNYYEWLIDKIEIDFLVFCSKCAFEDEYILKGSNVFHMESRRSNPFIFKRNVKKFFIENNSYDYVWIQSSSASNIVCHKAVKKYTKSKLITHAHVSKAETQKGIHKLLTCLLHKLNQKTLSRLTDYQLGCSRDALKYLFGNDMDGNVINNGIDIKRYYDEQNKKKENRLLLGISDEDTFVLGHVGRFSKIKNHTFIIDVFENMIKINNNVVLVLIGDGEERKNIQKLVEKRELIGNVKFLGERDCIEKYLSAMDAFIFPSFYEGFGIAVIEAQLSGVDCYINSSLPSELDISNKVHRISLDETAHTWALQIIQNRHEDLLIDDRVKLYDLSSSVKYFMNIIGI